MAWSEWKKFGASHLVIPIGFTYQSSATTFNRVFNNVWTNNTGKDVTLHGCLLLGIAGNGSPVYVRFRTSGGATLYDVTAKNFIEFSFTVPNGATLEMLTPQNVLAGGVLVDYDFTPNQALEE